MPRAFPSHEHATGCAGLFFLVGQWLSQARVERSNFCAGRLREQGNAFLGLAHILRKPQQRTTAFFPPVDHPCISKSHRR